MKKLAYPACFYPCEEHDGYMVTIPDLPGCVTEGASLADAIAMAMDAASGWLLDEMEDGKPIPQASNIQDIVLEKPEGFVNMIVLDMDAYAEKYGNKAVRKNVTLPAWLNTFAEENHVNFSQVLQRTLTKMYMAKVS
ncbi:MAG: type II toxin-antitoxin system HicB family antitoxin [Selenomonadaceae bacterium]|nr:type II toxin-antitoxin system HicB family antitoxin [Selenomonadaceae bacterium]